MVGCRTVVRDASPHLTSRPTARPAHSPAHVEPTSFMFLFSSPRHFPPLRYVLPTGTLCFIACLSFCVCVCVCVCVCICYRLKTLLHLLSLVSLRPWSLVGHIFPSYSRPSLYGSTNFSCASFPLPPLGREELWSAPPPKELGFRVHICGEHVCAGPFFIPFLNPQTSMSSRRFFFIFIFFLHRVSEKRGKGKGQRKRRASTKEA